MTRERKDRHLLLGIIRIEEAEGDGIEEGRSRHVDFCEQNILDLCVRSHCVSDSEGESDATSRAVGMSEVLCAVLLQSVYPAKNRGHRRADKTSEMNRKAMREICSTRNLFESRISVSLSQKTEPAQMPMKAPMTKVTIRPKDSSSCVRIDLARNHLATAMLQRQVQ